MGVHQRELPPESGDEVPYHLIDVKKVIAGVREHGHAYGADPTMVFVAGSSARGHLAALAAPTPNDPAFQPGFESEDTSVAAAVCLSGDYGSVDTQGAFPSSPPAYVRREAPPFFVVHGDQDTLGGGGYSAKLDTADGDAGGGPAANRRSRLARLLLGLEQDDRQPLAVGGL
jgi:acetyl esterase/lipase